MATKEQERFRLRNMKISRVDLVDRGANQEAHIKLAKRDDVEKNEKLGYPEKKPGNPKPKDSKPKGNGKSGNSGGLAERLRAAMAEAVGEAGGESKPKATPLGRPKGDQQRISRIRPADFELVEQDAQMMEWAIPEDKLPEGVEEATMTLIQGGEEVMFQWMIDPLAGPPVNGEAKSAPEAYAAMRAALTQGGAMDPTAMLGGLPGQQKAPGGLPGQAPGQTPAKPKPREKDPVAKAFAESTPEHRKVLKALATAHRESKQVSPTSLDKSQDRETLDNTLDLIVKGLVEVDVFNETATGADLRDILPANLLAELTNQLSATQSAE